MPAPISQYVLKVHSRCDLACDHCYVYEHADQSWRGKPAAISLDTAEMAARRIAEHARAHGLAEVCVVLHGGEPLLLGRERMHGVLHTLISRIAPVTGVDLRIHSNGVLLDAQWCELFGEYGVKVGVSLDGDQTANDRHRKFANGRSSYSQVLDALALLRRPEYRHLYAGILCTIDLANDPVAVYEALIAQEPPNCDLLLPHATWEHPPYRPAGRDSPYADWLMRVYRRWDHDGRRVPIRFFGSLLSAAQGGPSFTEALGTDPADLLVIETDGSWEQPDSMKTAFDGAAATDMSVFHDSVDDVARHPAVAARQRGIAALCVTCRECPVVRVCGGGLYAHRYRPGTGGSSLPDRNGAPFDNPSVFCADLKALIEQVMAEARIPAAAVGGPTGMRDTPTTRATPAARTTPAQTTPGTRAAHALPAGAFDRLAAGPGDAAAVSALGEMRLSQARSLVATVALRDDGWRDADLRAAAAEGWALLCALDADHPAAVRDVFSNPYTYAWAVRCLRPPAGADTDLDRAHLAGLAAAAALRAGVPAELALPVRDGMLYIPTAGAVAVSGSTGRTEVVSVGQGPLPVARGGGRWRRARYVTSAPFPRLAVEDLDPFRDCQEWPPTARLPVPEWRAWQRGLAAAGRRLAGAVPSYARALAAGLRAVVPLLPGTAGSRSATARQAFGAVAVALPGQAAPPGELSTLLLHEFQHVKLNALMDLHVLFDPGYTPRLRVPWREDLRPLEGVVHGTYAFLAVTHLCRSEGQAARAEYLRYRSWVCATAAALSATGALTRDGERFAAGMAQSAESPESAGE